MNEDRIIEQENIIQSQDKNIIVSASAGSGKTYIMIKKIVNLVQNQKCKVKDLLVLTYTNAAANEMKQKLINKISELDDKIVQEQIDDISNSDISTIDGFCQKLVKKYFYILNIDPSFNIVSGGEEERLKKKAYETAIKEYKTKNFEKYLYLFDCYAEKRTDKDIMKIVFDLFEFSKSVLDFNKFKNTTFDLFNGQENVKASQIVADYLKNEICDFKTDFVDILNLSKQNNFEVYYDAIQTFLYYCDTMLTLSDLGKIVDFAVEISKNFQKIPTKCKEDEFVLPKFKEARDSFKTFLKKITKYISSQILTKSYECCKKNVETIFEILDEFTKEYTKVKTNKNLCDFDDVERLAIQLFDYESVKKEIQETYKYIFVDEFQDSNAIQEKIIYSIKNGNNLFFVGDRKQAIYGFRQSNSKIFARIENEFKTNKSSSDAFELNCNFRTTKHILEFVNNIFNEIMTNQTASIDYKHTSKLVPKREFLNEDACAVELDILLNEKDKKEAPTTIYSLQEDIENKSEQNKSEAYFVAKKITELVGQKIYDINKQEYRQIEYSDIAILVKQRTHQEEYLKAFDLFNIPVIQNSKESLEDTYDVGVLINLMKVSVNFNDDLAVASVMSSSLFDFSYQEMFDIRHNSDCEYFYEAVKNYQKNDKIYQKITKMFEFLDKFYHICVFNGIIKALNFAITESNYLFKISSNNNIISRTKNIKDYIASFAGSKYNMSICEYLSFLEDTLREQKVNAGLSTNNYVTITTMHSSKGLEWPVVILPELDTKFYHSNKPGPVVMNLDYGFGLRFYDTNLRIKMDSVFYDAIRLQNDNDEFEELVRLFYVALTRPKNRLVLVGQTNKLDFKKNNTARKIKASSSFLNLLVGALNKNDIQKINEKYSSFNLYNNNKFVCNVIDDISIYDNISINNSIYENSADLSQVEKLVKYINQEYFNISATLIAEKNSVSSILKAEDDFASQNYIPEKLLTTEHLKDNVKKNELGSLYHKVIELYDFDGEISKSKVFEILNKIKKQGEFCDETIKEINVDIIIKNLLVLKNLAKNKKCQKEKTFVMQLPYNEIQTSNISDKVLVQGICDLIVFEDDCITLVDYKFSSYSNDILVKKYNKQLYLYKKALELAYNKPVKNVYILSLKSADLIALNPFI